MRICAIELLVVMTKPLLKVGMNFLIMGAVYMVCTPLAGYVSFPDHISTGCSGTGLFLT